MLQRQTSPGTLRRRGRYLALLLSSIVVGVLFLSVPLFWGQTLNAQGGDTPVLTLVSKNQAGDIGNFQSYAPSMSGNGQYVTFVSDATNLVADDDNGRADIFVVNTATGNVELVSLQSDGDQANDNSFSPVISSDGNWVAFWSFASNLVSGDDNGVDDIFLYDRIEDRVRRVSDAANGDDGNDASYGQPAISSDGRFVAFTSDASNLVVSDTNGMTDVFIYDRQDDKIRRVSVNDDGVEGNNASMNPSISASGRFIAFESLANNLVAGDDNQKKDIFVYDLNDGDIGRVSERANGEDSNVDSEQAFISADGQYVAFVAPDNNLVTGDTNNRLDVFVHNRTSNAIERVSLESDGGQGNNDSDEPALSSDGRYVVFASTATDLGVRGEDIVNIFLHDRTTDVTTAVSYNEADEPGNGSSDTPVISQDGRYIALASSATNLVQQDTNNRPDIYLYDRFQTAFTIMPLYVQPGGLFTAQVTNFRPDSLVAIYVNNVSLATIATDQNGSARFALNTSNASLGRYVVRVSDGTNTEYASIGVAADAPFVPSDATPILNIPAGIAYRPLYLPLVQ